LMARTDLRIGAQVIILIRARTLEAGLSRLLLGTEAQHKRIIHTPAPTRRRDKGQAPTPQGAGRNFREENKAQTPGTTPQPMEQWLAPRLRREEKRLPPVRSGEIRQLGKPPAATCTPHTMAMFTRTLATVGRSTTTAVGTQ